MDIDFSARIMLNNRSYMDVSSHEIHGARKINKVIHTHHMLELSLAKNGTGTYYIGDRQYDIQANDIFIINNIEDHGIGMEAGESMRNMVIHFEPRLVWAGEDFDSRYLKIFFDRSQEFCHRLDRDNEATKKIIELFNEIEEEFIHQPPEFNLMAKVKLLNILVLLLRHYNYVKEDDAVQDEKYYEIKIINKIIDYVDKNYDQEIMLQDMADIAHMNPAYFSTFFKKYNGITLTEYIVRKRISRAIEFLTGTDKTILDIANHCGFNNSANFNKAFKKITGLTPSQYKKQLIV